MLNIKLYRTPFVFKWIWNRSLWRTRSPFIYLTFDDGPVPEATEFVLDTLKAYNIKATFFCIGDNIQKHPAIFEKVKRAGHTVGNHTFNHLDGWKTKNGRYFDNIEKCQELAKATHFRPPYGRLKFSQYRMLLKRYKIVMWDVVTYDFEQKLNTYKALKQIQKLTRPGSIIVFHDSMKSLENVKKMLPAYIEFCLAKGYEFKPL